MTLHFDPELRRKLARGTDREVLARAFRLRAGLQGAMACCMCAWPIEKHQTPTEHAEACPAHHIILSALAAEGIR